MIIACSTLMVSCDSWLEVKPYDQISEGELLKSEEGYQKMLNGVYIDLNSEALYGQTLSVEMIEVMGGAYTIGSDNSVWGNYKDMASYQYATEYWRNRLDQTWNKAYALILNCNKILETIDGNQNLFTGGNYYAIKGEAMALRAMLHFDMLRLFGPVYAKDSDKMRYLIIISRPISLNLSSPPRRWLRRWWLIWKRRAPCLPTTL